MKRIIAFLLVMVITMSVCACGGDNGGGSKNNDVEMAKEPTDEELEDINNYLEAVEILNKYLEEGEISCYDEETDTTLEGHEALYYLYNVIKDAEGADKWVGVVEGYEGKMRRDVLDAFTIVKDVMLSETRCSYDRLGNLLSDEEGGATTFLYYDERGNFASGIEGIETIPTLFEGVGEGWIRHVEREYDEEGKVVRAEYTNQDEVLCIASYEYDSNGNLSVVHKEKQDRSVEFQLIYDEFNRVSVIKKTEKRGTSEKIELYGYTYNEEGLIVCEVLIKQNGEKKALVYFYEEGKLCATQGADYISWASMWDEYRKVPCETEYDEKGRIISRKVIDEDESYETYTYKYGDFYCYNPEKADVE